MSNKIISKLIPLSVIFTLTLSAGCLWRDDFRDRLQPQPLEPGPRPTLNPESLDYAGDPILEQIIEEKTMLLPAIDGLSTIPELPEYPAGVGCD